jgi:LysM repeat protein/two-component SAPR family response regulator
MIPAQESLATPLMAHPTVTVARHDTLWSLAEQHLGSGSRFREIVNLNLGVTQPDGRALTGSHWIYPGWVLRLPADARVATAVSGAETYVVRPGDTLSGIAQAELGDADRAAELFNINEGHPMGDGESLAQPDLIRPGWVLDLAGSRHPHPEVTESPLPDKEQTAPETESPPAAHELPEPSAAPATPQGHQAEFESSGSNAFEAGAALALGLVTATGLVRELRQRRRQQQRTRAAGARIPMPTAPAARAEREAAVHEAPMTVDTATRSLRALAASCRDAGRPLPDVLLVRLSPSSVRLQLASDDLEAASPFVLEESRVWRLAEPFGEVGEDDPYPALLTVGVDGPEVLLLNLECVGSLNVVDAEGDVVRAMLADAAVGPFSAGSGLVFAEGFDELSSVLDPVRCRVVRDSQAAQTDLEARRDEVRRVLGPTAARTRHLSSEGLLPEIVFTRNALPVTQLAWSGVCHVSADEVAVGSECELRVESASVARLSPQDIVFEPQALPIDGWERVVELLGKAATPPAEPPVENVRAAVARALPEVPATVLDLREEGPTPPRLLVLGRVHVEGADDSAAPHRRRRASELVAYLALHPGATGREIDEALWPGRRVEKSTRNPFISRARQWLGKGPDGEPYLPLVADGGSYRLRPEVSCDWHDFVRFSQLGLESGAPGATALSAALDLVRGRPFLGVDPATYTWAEADIQEMISAIVDVAHVLAEMRLEAGDFRGAQQAAARGMLAEPCSELLYRDSMKAAIAIGDLDELERLSRRLRAEITLIDPDETFDDETIELLSSRSQLTR